MKAKQRITRKQARNIVQTTVECIGGPRLPRQAIIFVENPKGVSTANFTLDGALQSLWLGPPTYWQEDPKRLIALTASEYAGKFFTDFSLRELAYMQALENLEQKGRCKKCTLERLELKNEFELGQGVFLDQLLRKMKVDAKAIELLKRVKLPTSGYKRFLETELKHTNTFVEAPRKYAYVVGYLLRIAYAEALLKGKARTIALSKRLEQIVQSI